MKLADALPLGKKGLCGFFNVHVTFHKCMPYIYSVFWGFPWRGKVISFIPMVLMAKAGAFILNSLELSLITLSDLHCAAEIMHVMLKTIRLERLKI